LHQATVEIDGKSPSPRQLKTLLAEAKEEGFTVVFVQPQFNERPAKMIAERIGGRVVPINPLDEDPVAVLAKAVDALAGK
jgi:zinc transport system substrate-binding protein